jgi:PAS domain S-box-containing protein
MPLDTRPEEGLLARSAALKALIASSSDLVAVLEPERSVIHANDGFARVLGCSADELLGKILDSLHHPAEQRGVLDKFDEAQSTPEKKCGGRCRLRSKEGSWLWFDFEIANHLQTPGIEGWLVSYRNVTELRRLEAERQVISDVVHALNQTSNLDQLLFRIHQALKKVVYAENCFVALREPATEMFHLHFSWTSLIRPLRRKKLRAHAWRTSFEREKRSLFRKRSLTGLPRKAKWSLWVLRRQRGWAFR